MDKYKSDCISAIFLIFLGIIIYISIFKFPVGTQLYPKIIAFSLIASSLILLIMSFFYISPKRRKNGEKIIIATPIVFYFFLVNLVFVFSISFIGFYLASLLYLLGSLYLLGEKKFLKSFLYGLTLVVFLYIVFTVFLHVPVPKGYFFC